MNTVNLSKRKLRKGITLVEVLFGVFLATFCVLILAAGMPTATTARIKADNNNKATSLAQKELEAIRGVGYANLTGDRLFSYGLTDSKTPITGSTYSFTNVDLGLNDNAAKILNQGAGTVTVNQVSIGLREVIITVSWFDKSVKKSVTIGTRIAEL